MRGKKFVQHFVQPGKKVRARFRTLFRTQFSYTFFVHFFAHPNIRSQCMNHWSENSSGCYEDVLGKGRAESARRGERFLNGKEFPRPSSKTCRLKGIICLLARVLPRARLLFPSKFIRTKNIKTSPPERKNFPA